MKAYKVSLRSLYPFLIGVVLFGFQNCSEVQFGSQDPVAGKSGGVINTGNDGLDVGVEEPPAEEPPAEEPPAEENCDMASSSDGDSGVDCDDSSNEDPSIEEDEDDVQESTFRCDVAEIKDVILNVKELSLGNKSVDGLKGLRSLSQLSEATVFITSEQAKSNQLRLVLNSDDNQIVDNNDRHFGLKTPSAQQSGVKIILNKAGVRKFSAHSSYSLKFDLDLENQVVQTGSGKCILKPVLHATVIEAI